MATYLLVAHQTAMSPELLRAAKGLVKEDPRAEFVLLVPATPVGDLLVPDEGEAEEVARQTAERARSRLQRRGIRIISAKIGNADPLVAISEELQDGAKQYAAILVSTLPAGISGWLRLDLVSRIKRSFPDQQVIHVLSQGLDMSEPVLVAEGVSKSFPGVKALDKVDFFVRPGEVNALVGENGAGKSTLIKLMAGLYSPDQGEIRVAGERLTADPAAGHAAGVATIHQEVQLVPNMTVAENIVLGRWPTQFGLTSPGEQFDRAVSALKTVAPHISPSTLARRLSPADGQLVEIARAISEDPHVLIMDEPTTSLSPPEIKRLFAVVEDLKDGGLGVVFVSHWMDEIFSISDRITVLRDGRLVGTAPAADLDEESVIKMMVGRALDITREHSTRPVGEEVLQVRNLSRRGQMEDVSLSVRAGEIVTLAGLVGAGRSEFVNCVFGIDRFDSGEVRVGGKLVPPGDPHAAIDAGLGLVPEDRRTQALVSGLSVSANLTLSVLGSIAPGGWLSAQREREVATTQAKALRVKAPSLGALVATLSGGNQQKVVIGRWLARNPRLLILDEPTKGIDVGAKAEIHNLISRLAEEGMAILLVTSEMPEVLLLSDRVLVMRLGRLVGEVDRAELTAEAVMRYATSG